jgi:uroporphyrinogen-III synthase
MVQDNNRLHPLSHPALESQLKGLEGLTVAVTGSRRASELAHMIESMGGRAYVAPTVGIETDLPSSAAEALIRNVIDGKVDYCVFKTALGTFGVMARAEKLGPKDEFVRALNRMKMVARSPKPKVALEKHGVKSISCQKILMTTLRKA